MNYNNSNLTISDSQIDSGEISWRCPSNIALIKYWGKKTGQIPQNPSLSFTLDSSYTQMTLKYQSKKNLGSSDLDLSYSFAGSNNINFQQRIKKYLESILEIYPFLTGLKLEIHSTNSFPHSAGIASSASSMGALALILCSLEKRIFNTLSDKNEFDQKASYLARLASGSASRSIYPAIACWGKNSDISQASDEFAVPLDLEKDIDPIFHNFCDSILIISSAPKEISSSDGHLLMNDNPYAGVRYQQAGINFSHLLTALGSGDLKLFSEIVINEALSLHSLMMTSRPSFLLIKPQTLAAIEKINTLKKSTGYDLAYTLDAGPNIHLLYPERLKIEIKDFIERELKIYLENGHYIEDRVGMGPQEIL